jgi:hypothetical protein
MSALDNVQASFAGLTVKDHLQSEKWWSSHTCRDGDKTIDPMITSSLSPAGYVQFMPKSLTVQCFSDACSRRPDSLENSGGSSKLTSETLQTRSFARSSCFIHRGYHDNQLQQLKLGIPRGDVTGGEGITGSMTLPSQMSPLQSSPPVLPMSGNYNHEQVDGMGHVLVQSSVLCTMAGGTYTADMISPLETLHQPASFQTLFFLGIIKF